MNTKNRVIIRISLYKKRHKDVIDALEACPKTMRAEYIVDAIRFTSRSLLLLFWAFLPLSMTSRQFKT